MAADPHNKLIAALSGRQRAAVLLMALGEDEAGQVLRHLTARDVQSVGGAMAALKNVSRDQADAVRSEEHTSELQSLMRNSYAVFCLKKKNKKKTITACTKIYTTRIVHSNTSTEI